MRRESKRNYIETSINSERALMNNKRIVQVIYVVINNMLHGG